MPPGTAERNDALRKFELASRCLQTLLRNSGCSVDVIDASSECECEYSNGERLFVVNHRHEEDSAVVLGVFGRRCLQISL